MSDHSPKPDAPKEQVDNALLLARQGREQSSVEALERLLSDYPEDLLVLGYDPT